MTHFYHGVECPRQGSPGGVGSTSSTALPSLEAIPGEKFEPKVFRLSLGHNMLATCFEGKEQFKW